MTSKQKARARQKAKAATQESFHRWKKKPRARPNPDINPVTLAQVMQLAETYTSTFTAQSLSMNLLPAPGRVPRWEAEVLHCMRYLAECGFLERRGQHVRHIGGKIGDLDTRGVQRIDDPSPDEITAKTPFAMNDDWRARAPRWPRRVFDTKEADSLLMNQHFWNTIRMLVPEGDAWHIDWEYPGYVGISHPAGEHEIAVGSDGTRHPYKIMLQIDINDREMVGIAGEEGYFEEWPTTSLVALALIRFFMDKYHP